MEPRDSRPSLNEAAIEKLAEKKSGEEPGSLLLESEWEMSCERLSTAGRRHAGRWSAATIGRLRCPGAGSAAECAIIGEEREVIIKSDLKWLQKRLCAAEVLNDPAQDWILDTTVGTDSAPAGARVLCLFF